MLQYFGFRDEPFGTNPDARCLYLTRTHQQALEALELGFSSKRGFIAMIAPPGMGKTTLLFCFLEEARETACTAFLFDIDAQCEPRDFVAYILRDIGIAPAQTSSEMHEQLSQALIKENQAGRRFVVVIDEAQNLSDAVLERVRLLTNFETSRGKLMQMVLSGQPQLSDKLMQPSLVQLRQRISTVCHIEPLSAQETAGYIDYRLKLAGYEGEPLFTINALELIANASQGVPRIINNLCFNALVLCHKLKSNQVDSSMVTKAIASLELTPQPAEPVAVAAVDAAPEQPRKRKRFTSLGLSSKSEEPVAAASDFAAEEPFQPGKPKPAKRRLLLWIPTAAVLLVACMVGLVELVNLPALQSRNTASDSSLNAPVPPDSDPAPAAPAPGAPTATEPASSTASFQVTVQPDQSLHDISVKYLGGWDSQRMHQIQALNPELTDPDHIDVGQKIWLPGPPPVQAATSGTPSDPAHEPSPADSSTPKPSESAPAAVTLPPTSAAAKPGQPTFAGNAQQAAQTGGLPNVRPALPAAGPVMVQVAVVASPRDAESLVIALLKLGYAVTARRDAEDKLIHVRVGPFNSRNEAERWRAMLENQGYNAVIEP
jgi:type II secretory pathway predicted ATPase ExeA/cell division protein FtsN